MEDGEGAHLAAEEEERQKHLDAMEESRMTRSFSQAGTFVRNLSLKGKDREEGGREGGGVCKKGHIEGALGQGGRLA